MSSTDLTNSPVFSDDKSDRKDVTSIDIRSADTEEKDGELLLPERRAAAERHLVRMLDMRLLPTIVLIFILNYIDVSKYNNVRDDLPVC